jgi:cathepsin E
MDVCLWFCIISSTFLCSLGPDDLTIGRLRPSNTFVVQTVTDNLFDQGTIGQKLVAVSFEPTTSVVATNGEVTFGAVDSTKFTGEITYVYVCTAR